MKEKNERLEKKINASQVSKPFFFLRFREISDTVNMNIASLSSFLWFIFQQTREICKHYPETLHHERTNKWTSEKKKTELFLNINKIIFISRLPYFYTALCTLLFLAVCFSPTTYNLCIENIVSYPFPPLRFSANQKVLLN